MCWDMSVNAMHTLCFSAGEPSRIRRFQALGRLHPLARRGDAPRLVHGHGVASVDREVDTFLCSAGLPFSTEA